MYSLIVLEARAAFFLKVWERTHLLALPSIQRLPAVLGLCTHITPTSASKVTSPLRSPPSHLPLISTLVITLGSPG